VRVADDACARRGVGVTAATGPCAQGRATVSHVASLVLIALHLSPSLPIVVLALVLMLPRSGL
jgi:hypothetical protein